MTELPKNAVRRMQEKGEGFYLVLSLNGALSIKHIDFFDGVCYDTGSYLYGRQIPEEIHKQLERDVYPMLVKNMKLTMLIPTNAPHLLPEFEKRQIPYLLYNPSRLEI